MDFLKFSVLIFVICSVNSSPVEVNDLTNGISEFARDFYSKCVEKDPGNLIVSPLSVASALALLSQGSNGKTFEELKTGLHLSDNKTISANQFLEHREMLHKNAGEAILSIAHRIYVQQGKQLTKNFQEVAISKFNSNVEPLNFTESEKSAKIINNFVEEKTNGKIKELIKSTQLNDATRSVLVNAIYFKGVWDRPFMKEHTRLKDFHISETEKKSVDFMFTTDVFKYAYFKDLKMSALEMNYANSNLSFVIVLPTKRMGLTALESQLKNYDWAKITEQMYMQEVEVYIPKFKIEYEIKLNDVLKNMGMGEMFTENADLSGILESSEPLRVSDVIHKAFIEVNEEGTEAAAATYFGGYFSGISGPQFFADHPFMYFIRDTQTNTIVFSGRLVEFA